MRDVGVLSLCGLGERSSFLSWELSPFTLHVCPDWNSNHNKPLVKPAHTKIRLRLLSFSGAHGDLLMVFRYASLDALSDQQPQSEEEGGSGKATASGPPLQAAPAPSASPDPTGQPKPGLNAGTASGGRLEGSGEAWAEPEAEGEAEADSALVGMRSDAGERPPEEEAEAERWQLGVTSELRMQTRWWQRERKKRTRFGGHCWVCAAGCWSVFSLKEKEHWSWSLGVSLWGRWAGAVCGWELLLWPAAGWAGDEPLADPVDRTAAAWQEHGPALESRLQGGRCIERHEEQNQQHNVCCEKDWKRSITLATWAGF